MKLIPLWLVVGLALCLIGCSKKSGSGEEEEGAGTKPMVAVKAIALHRGEMANVVAAMGRVDALGKQKLFAPVAGRVTSVKVLEGASVQTGDVLAVLQTKESQAAIAGAEALIREAKTPAQREEARHALDLARSSENSVMIRSAFDGSIATRSISEGEFVAENAELFTIVDQSTLVFVADVPVGDFSSVHVGQHALVNLQAVEGKELRGVVDALSPQSDAMSQTVKVRLRFVGLVPEDRRVLRMDMIGTAAIVVGVQKGVFVVPKAAVLRNDEANSYSLVTFAGDSLACSIPVEVTGMTDSTYAIRGAGLQEGMNIITEGHYALADSTRITVVQ
jgi:multidrug efflux pump subunit AcrA (membrane-fusion protein)